MMHRQTNTSGFSPRRKMDDETTTRNLIHLPLYNDRSNPCKSSISSLSKLHPEKLVHAMPVVVLLCLFMLWWFSYPVQVEIKNGQITGIYKVIIMDSIPFLHHTNLASVAAAPYPIPEIKMSKNGSMAEQANGPG